MNEQIDAQVARVARHAQKFDHRIAVAESLTGGNLSAALSKGDNAGEWFCGGITAYKARVKFDVLGVRPGPVVAAEVAKTMAESALTLFGATFTVALTGVGGPGPEEGEPAGTVFMAVAQKGGPCEVSRHQFTGEPEEVVRATVTAALARLEAALTALPAASA